MKFTLFALLAAVCVLAVHAGTSVIEPRDIELEQTPVDGIEIEGQWWLFSKVGWAIKHSLRTLKGFNCLIKWVLGIQASAEQYAIDVGRCGVNATKQVTKLLKANLDIVNTCNNIIHIKTKVCNITDEEPEEQKITNSCAAKTLSQIWKLYLQVKKAVRLAKKVPKGATDSAGCVVDATNKLTVYYTQFPQNIISCSKLTSKK